MNVGHGTRVTEPQDAIVSCVRSGDCHVPCANIVIDTLAVVLGGGGRSGRKFWEEDELLSAVL